MKHNRIKTISPNKIQVRTLDYSILRSTIFYSIIFIAFLLFLIANDLEFNISNIGLLLIMITGLYIGIYRIAILNLTNKYIETGDEIILINNKSYKKDIVSHIVVSAGSSGINGITSSYIVSIVFREPMKVYEKKIIALQAKIEAVSVAKDIANFLEIDVEIT